MDDADPRGSGLLRGGQLHLDTINEDAAITWWQQARQHLYQGRFAGAVFADNAENLACREAERDPVIRAQGAEVPGQAADLEQASRRYRHG